MTQIWSIMFFIIPFMLNYTPIILRIILEYWVASKFLQHNSLRPIYKVSRKIFAEGNFNLRMFITSSVSLQQKIDKHNPEAGSNVDCSNNVVEEDATYTDGLLTGNCATGAQKVLGIRWNPTILNLTWQTLPDFSMNWNPQNAT